MRVGVSVATKILCKQTRGTVPLASLPVMQVPDFYTNIMVCICDVLKALHEVSDTWRRRST